MTSVGLPQQQGPLYNLKQTIYFLMIGIGSTDKPMAIRTCMSNVFVLTLNEELGTALNLASGITGHTFVPTSVRWLCFSYQQGTQAVICKHEFYSSTLTDYSVVFVPVDVRFRCSWRKKNCSTVTQANLATVTSFTLKGKSWVINCSTFRVL